MPLDDLHLWYLADPTNPVYVGALKLVAAGKGVSLTYATSWLTTGFPLSEDLPLRAGEFSPPGRLQADAPRAVGAVDDARPDRWGEKVIRYLVKLQRRSLLEYLYHAGDDRFGALGVSTSAERYIPQGTGPLPRLSQAQELSEVAAKIEADETITEVEKKIFHAGGSLGGAKPKALIEIDGEQWVIKFFNGEPVDTPLIEHATMTLARKAGINTAETRPIRLAAANAVAVRRFDRKGDRRIHSISAGTAIRAVTPGGSEPDMGYPALAQILRRRGAGAAVQNDARELFMRMVFNILVDNTDDHEKNHSLLVENPAEYGSLTLAPAYDVLPTNSGQGYQEFGCGDDGQESTLKNAMSQCEAFGLSPADAAAEIVRIIAVVDTWEAHFRELHVSETDILNLAERLNDGELLKQRRQFDPTQYQAKAVKPRRASPFRRP
jgi:serine/threonine-protein kinase HipA